MRGVNTDLFRRVQSVFSIIEIGSYSIIDLVLCLDLPVLQMARAIPLHLDICNSVPFVIFLAPSEELSAFLIVLRPFLVVGPEGNVDLWNGIAVRVLTQPCPMDHTLVPLLLVVHAVDFVTCFQSIPMVKVICVGSEWGYSAVHQVKSLDEGLSIVFILDV